MILAKTIYFIIFKKLIMDKVYLDPVRKTIQYENSWDENLIPVETEKEPRHMTYQEVKEFVKDLVDKLVKPWHQD